MASLRRRRHRLALLRQILKAPSSVVCVVAVGGQEGLDGLPDVLDPLAGHHRPGQGLVPAPDQAHQDQPRGDLDEGPVGGDPAEGPVEIVLVRGCSFPSPGVGGGRGGGARRTHDPASAGEGQDVCGSCASRHDASQPGGPSPVLLGPRPPEGGGQYPERRLRAGTVADRPNLPVTAGGVTRGSPTSARRDRKLCFSPTSERSMKGHGGPSRIRIMSVPRYWLTVEEAAEYTGIEESAIRRDIRDGYLHPRRLGTKVAIVDAELERWVRIRRYRRPRQSAALPLRAGPRGEVPEPDSGRSGPRPMTGSRSRRGYSRPGSGADGSGRSGQGHPQSTPELAPSLTGEPGTGVRGQSGRSVRGSAAAVR